MLNHSSEQQTANSLNLASSQQRTANSLKLANSQHQTANSLNLADSKQRTANSKQLAAGNYLRRRAQAIINNTSIDAVTQAIIRYGLEINDPLLPELVRRVDAGETIFETIVVLKRPKLIPTVRRGKRSKR